MKHYKCLMTLLFFLGYSTAWSGNLVESGNKLQIADNILIKYVIPMGLEGRQGSYALEKIINEGFSCNLEPHRIIGINEPPLIACIKTPSGYGALCNDLYVALRFEHMTPPPSTEEMLRNLDKMTVRSASTFCPYMPEGSVELLAHRAEAEALLGERVDNLQLPGNARRAYEKLLIEGFYCGFDREGESVSTAKLVCTRRSSGIKYCYQSRLVMDIDWDKTITSKDGLFKGLNTSQVTDVHSSCDIPEIKTEGGSF